MVHSCTEPPTQCRGKHNDPKTSSQKKRKKNTSCNVEAKLNLVPSGRQKSALLVPPTAKLWRKHPQRQASTGQGTSKLAVGVPHPTKKNRPGMNVGREKEG